MTIFMHDTANDAERHTLSPITCAPWCTQGDGHPHEIFIEDQRCGGADADVSTADGELTVYLNRPAGGATHVVVSLQSSNPDQPVAELAMSPERFREWLVSAEKNLATALDGTAGSDR